MNLIRTIVGVFRPSALIPCFIAILFASGLRPAPAADNVVALASSGTLAISDVTLSRSRVPRFETVEFTFRITAAGMQTGTTSRTAAF